MGTLRRQVIFFALLCACSSDEKPPSGGGSPCKAFARAPAPKYELEPFGSVAGATRITSSSSSPSKAYGLVGGTRVVALSDGAVALEVDGALDIAARGARLWVLKSGLEVVRFTSADGGKTFGAPESVAKIPDATSGAIALSGDVNSDVVWVATAGKMLRITDAAVETYARGFEMPSAIDIDPDSGDVWVLDRGKVYRVLRDKTYGPGPKDVPPVIRAEGSSLVVHRGGVSPLVGKPVLGGATIAAVIPFAASGPAATVALDVGGGVVGRGPTGELLVARADAVFRARDIAPAAPRMLSQTGCLDPKAAGAIEYSVAVPLWSDGAEKSRAVVVPGRGRALDDGDVRLPVGTVAIKTFTVDGRRVETRLLVQHALETWVGYSYAWNDAGTDAELVIGNRTKTLGDGKRWYFPSTADCTACHTPAAGYTLGLEAKQVANLDAIVQAPVDRAKHPLFDVEGSVEARARAYLHANCSICHREGSATGVAELDLRASVPLAATGLCNPPKAGTLETTDGARLIVPKDPEQSILIKRMKALDENRMPKLATHVVDAFAVTLVAEWIGSLSACPP